MFKIVCLALLVVLSNAQCTGLSCETCKTTSGCGYCDFGSGVGLCLPSSTCVSPGQLVTGQCPTTSNPAVSACALKYSSNCTGCAADPDCRTCTLSGMPLCYPATEQASCTPIGTWNAACPATSLSDCVVLTTFSRCQANADCGWCSMGSSGYCTTKATQSSCYGLWNSEIASGTCSAISGLQTCTSLNGRQTDIVAAATAVDLFATNNWGTMVDEITRIASKNGFSVCNACLDALKTFFCEASAPPCGFYTCFLEQAQAISTCASGCSTQLSSTTTNTLQADDFRCYSNCASQALTACGQYLISKSTCKSLVAICGCATEDVQNTACQYFPDNGVNVTLGSGSCSNVQGWCASPSTSVKVNSNAFALQDVSANVIRPNPHLTISIPSTSGDAKVGALVAPADNSSAVSLSVSLYTLLSVFALAFWS